MYVRCSITEDVLYVSVCMRVCEHACAWSHYRRRVDIVYVFVYMCMCVYIISLQAQVLRPV